MSALLDFSKGTLALGLSDDESSNNFTLAVLLLLWVFTTISGEWVRNLVLQTVRIRNYNAMLLTMKYE